MAFLMGPLTLHLRQRRDSIESSFLVIWKTFEKIFFEFVANNKFSLAKNFEHKSIFLFLTTFLKESIKYKFSNSVLNTLIDYSKKLYLLS